MELDQMLSQMGQEIAEGTFDESAVRRLVEAAERFGVADTATLVLADPDAPYVVRCRAFDKVAGALRHNRRSTPSFVVAA